MSGEGRAVWLVEGGDATLVAEAIRGVVDQLVGGGDRTLMVEDFRGDEVDLAAVADACRTLPLLTDRRVVVLRDVGRFSGEELAPIVEYIEDPSVTTSLVLGAGGGSGRTSTTLVSAVKAHGHVTSTAVGRDSAGWVRDRVAASPLRLDGAAVAALATHLGEDVSRLGGILDVLGAAYGDGVSLGPEDIEPYLGQGGSVAPWDLTDAIDAGRAEPALELLHRMLGAGERHPLVVLAALHRHVAAMLRVDSPSITTEATAAAAMGIAKGKSTFPAKKALGSARRLGSSGIATAIGLLADAELDLKGATEWSGPLVCEVLVARLCQLSRAAGARGAAPARR